MNERRWGWFAVGFMVIVGAVLFGLGINWGLWSPEVDQTLSPDGVALGSGVQIDHLAGDWLTDASASSDMETHPIADRSRPVTLLENNPGAGPNRTDAVNRARIIRRYRLYSFQPDEMITFRALASMHPGALKLDPKLYQYGGLWIYPIGALLQAGSELGLVEISADREFYLDNPQAFGRFYVVARAYSAAWGIAGALVVFAILRRAVGGIYFPLVGALCFLTMPVVVDLGHEAKPHLAGTVLLLLEIFAGMRYAETGKLKCLFAMAVAAGAAAGMVLSGAVGLIMIPTVLVVRSQSLNKRIGLCIFGIAVAVGIYFLTNPYVAMHLIFADQRSVLINNLANTRAMYSRGSLSAGLTNSVRLIAAGVSFPMLVFGLGGMIVWAVSRAGPDGDLQEAGELSDAEHCRNASFKKCREASRVLGWLLAVVAIIVGCQFVLYAADKPGEYGRFSLFVDVALVMSAVVAGGRFARSPTQLVLVGLVLLVSTACGSFAYEAGFVRDATGDNSRTRTASALRTIFGQLAANGTPTLYVKTEPAPYCLPPVDLFRWKIVLLPKGAEAPAEDGVLVAPEEAVNALDLESSSISWAGKPFRVTFSRQ